MVAGALKVTTPASSALAVRAYQLLPYDVAGVSATPCRWSRSRSALLLVLGLFTRAAAVVGGLLMVAFLVGIISAWARGLTIDCGCFGGGGTIAAAQTHYLSEIAAGRRARRCARPGSSSAPAPPSASTDVLF